MIPRVEKNVLDSDRFVFLQKYFMDHADINFKRFDKYGSKRIDSFDDKELEKLLVDFLPFAKKWFGKKEIVPTYAIFADYVGNQANLDEHYDIGPCTYTIDLCLYEKTSWPLIIENKEYFFHENEAVLFLANDQKHWKKSFPDPENNRVGIVLLHYVDPDHQWLKLKPETQKVLRQKMKAI